MLDFSIMNNNSPKIDAVEMYTKCILFTYKFNAIWRKCTQNWRRNDFQIL